MGPETQLSIRNSGPVPIRYFEVLIEYYNEAEKNILSRERRIVVSSSDPPLLPGEKSPLISVRSVPVYEMSLAQKLSLQLDILGVGSVPDSILRTLQTRVYYKQSYASDWQLVKDQ